MTVTSPFEAAAAAIQAIIAVEFAVEGFTAILDDIHESVGWNGPRIGIAPMYDIPKPDGYIVQETWIQLQFFNSWVKDINPDQTVDPSIIANFAERFRRRARTTSFNVGTQEVWYFNIERVDYPRDPTGNKTRFVATIRAFGQNAGLVETIG